MRPTCRRLTTSSAIAIIHITDTIKPAEHRIIRATVLSPLSEKMRTRIATEIPEMSVPSNNQGASVTPPDEIVSNMLAW